jgi:hypothetical protein
MERFLGMPLLGSDLIHDPKAKIQCYSIIINTNYNCRIKYNHFIEGAQQHKYSK